MPPCRIVVETLPATSFFVSSGRQVSEERSYLAIVPPGSLTATTSLRGRSLSMVSLPIT